MKTKQYVKKYELDKDDNFNHKDFIEDFTSDFIDLINESDASSSYGKFVRVINTMKEKWWNINKKTVGQLPDSLWKYFYAAVVIAKRDELFPERVRVEAN